MKRFGNLYEKTFTVDALYDAFLKTRAGKRQNVACFRMERRLGGALQELHDELMSDTYTPRPFYSFMVHEPKTREIQAPAFRDGVVQHAIYRTINPIFDATFCRDSFACRVGKGTHRASERARKFMRTSGPDDYYVEMDIRKFFPSINHDILYGLLVRKIKDRRLLRVMRTFFGDSGRGLPIGYLLSQIYANIYLNEVDQYCKRHMEMPRYVRYMDNFACIGISSLARARAILESVRGFVDRKLDMALSKFTIQKIRKGFNFVGYRTWQSKKFIRKYSLYNFSRALRDGRLDSVVSILGHARHSRSLGYLLTMAKEKNNVLYHQIPESIRRLHHAPAADTA